MLDRTWLQMVAKNIIDKVEDNNMKPERFISELYSAMMYINQLFGQEMERWLSENHYKMGGEK